MKDHPIIFSGEMVKAILEGRKTQTRRVIKLPGDARDVRYWDTPTHRPQAGYADPGVNYWTTEGNHIDACPYGFPGDWLWVRETWAMSDCNVRYRADGEWEDEEREMGYNARWRPSIHLPRIFSRITLEIVSVRVERVQDIERDDAKAEGVSGVWEWMGQNDKKPFERGALNPYVENYSVLWDSINAKRGYGWDANPWVWVIEFKRIEHGTLSR